MDSLEHLIDLLPDSGPHDDSPTYERALYRLRCGLAQASAPVTWLNQVATALAAQAEQPGARVQGLPESLREHEQSIGEHLEHWRSALERESLQQAREYAGLLALGSLPSRYPWKLLAQHQEAHLQRLLERFGQEAPSVEVLSAWRGLRASRHTAWKRLNTLLLDQDANLQLSLTTLREATYAAMRAEAGLLVEEGELADEVRQRLLTPSSEHPAIWLAVQAGEDAVPGAWVLAEASGWSSGRLDVPLLLWVHGEGGGMACLDDRHALLERLASTLREGGLPIAAALPDDETTLRLVPVQGGLDSLLQAMLEHWQGSLADVPSQDEAQERRLALARAALGIAADTCRQAALDQAERQWQVDALLQSIPSWVLPRSDTERQAYAEQLREYHEASLALEARLQAEAPTFSSWAGNRLKARIEQDLGIEVDIDEILLWRPDPSLDQNLPYIPSTVSQIACEGIDPDSDTEYQRLDRARWPVEGIEPHYLARVLRELDPLKHYEAKLLKAFDPEQVQPPERLRLPYQLELQLLATSERWRGGLSEEGARMLQQAAAAHSWQALQAVGIRLRWVVVQSDDELGQALSGSAALVNEAGRAVLYLPGATPSVLLIERDSLESALEFLASQINSRPEVVDYVAQRCGNDPVRMAAYLRQAGIRGYSGYLKTAPCLEQTLVGLQLAERRDRLLDQARQQGRSQASIRKDNAYDAHLRHTGYLRAALGVVPGLGAWYSITDIHEGAQQLAESWRSGSSVQMIHGTLSIVMGIIDICSTALPVGGSVLALRRLVRQVSRQRVARLPLRGYASGQLLDGAEPLQGLDANTWRKQGRQYIWQDGLAYEVYRRSDEATLRLRATATRRYEAPVRQDGGRWVMHGDVGLRGGGGKLTDAERLFAEWGPRSHHPALTGLGRTQAVARGRQELARYRFPSPHQQVEFTYAYLQDGVAPGWARQYLRRGTALGVDAPADAWQTVRWTIRQGDRVVDLHGGRVNVYFAGSQATTAQPGLRLRGQYYPTLAGDAFGNIAYVRPRARMPGNLAELDALIEQGAGPVRVALGATVIDAPTIVGGFTETFRQRLAARFPSLSEQSRQALGETLYRNADRSTAQLSHARMVRLEQRVADVNLEPLQELAEVPVLGYTRHLTLASRDGLFQQLHWELLPGEHQALRNALGQVEPAALNGVLSDVLTARGYQLINHVGNAERHLLLLRRAGLPEIYVLLHGRTLGPISLRGGSGLVVLSDAWMDVLLASVHDPRVASLLRSARQDGLLRPMLGGVHLDGPNRSVLVWERVRPVAASSAQLPRLRNWRDDLRPFTPADRELVPGSGLYGAEGQASVLGVEVNGRLLPVFPVETDSHILLSRSSDLATSLSFDDLERCLRERFGEQPWLMTRGPSGWAVRRPLFNAPLDRHVERARAGMTRQSSLNAARHVFERAQGSAHERLIYLEHVTSCWGYGSRPVDELADPLLLLREQQPTGLDAGAVWRLALPADVPSAMPTVYYLRAVDDYTQGLLAAVSGTRMRQHALSLIDDMLVRYGLSQRHRVGAVALYHQASSNRSYLVAMAVSEQPGVEFAVQEGRAVLSNEWLAQWRQQLPAEAAQRLQRAEEGGRLVRMVAVLRLEEGPHAGQLALQRLADF
ncbi:MULTISPECIES: hypothetical protein [unclassified Pseudomonas]|uniref:hypothetical protein n=1 Tax=unclassified Pseudomonas TaxID=196821 RepID=UPI0035C18B15